MASELRRELRLFDLVLFHVTAILSVRWISYTAARGPSSLTLWAISFAAFFVPAAAAVIDFNRRMPQQGGIYLWTKTAFGPLQGFLCAWSYVVSNLVFFPALLVTVAGYSTTVIPGAPATPESSPLYTASFSIAVLWIVLLLS